MVNQVYPLVVGIMGRAGGIQAISIEGNDIRARWVMIIVDIGIEEDSVGSWVAGGRR